MEITATNRQEFIRNYVAWKGSGLALARQVGYLYDYETLALNVLAYSLKPEAVIVNIGAGSGTSALALCETRPDLAKNLYTIDIDPGSMYGGLQNERNAFDNAGITRDKDNQILGNSQEISFDWDLPIDLLFIDADHELIGVQKDIDGWLPHLNSGGIVCFHDYASPDWPDVKKAVDFSVARYNLTPIFIIDTLAVYRMR